MQHFELGHFITATCYNIHFEIGYWVMHQPVMVQNKQENCTDFPYKPLLRVELANGSLEREVCADTLVHGKEIMYCMLLGELFTSNREMHHPLYEK